VKLASAFCIAQRGVVAIHGRANGAPTDAVAGLVEAHQRALRPPVPGIRLAAGR